MIDEKKLIEILEDWKSKNEEKGYDTAKDLIQEMLYIVNEQPKTDWIPCEERLPNKAFVTVWLCFTNEYTSYIKKASWHGENFYWKNGKKVKEKPIAWMEYIVPQPYKKEGEADGCS